MRSIKYTFGLFVIGALAACGGGESGGTTPPTTNAVSTVIVSPSSASIGVGATQTLSFEARNASGTVLSGRTATWSSSNTSAVTVDASGVVKGIAVGSAIVGATVEGKAGSTTITVTQPQVATVTLSASSNSLTAGTTLSVTVTLKDQPGTTLTGRSIVWATSNSRVATVDANGLVTGASAGSVTITATSEGVSGTLVLTVIAPAGSSVPTISGVSPATLTVGSAATISGTGFATPATGNIVFISGKQATVTGGTATQLTVTVPTTIPCQSTQQVNVEVTTVGGTATAKQSLVVATQRTLAVGATFVATAGTALGCNELPANGTYLVAVANASNSWSATTSMELSGTAGGTGTSAVAQLPALLRAPVVAAAPAHDFYVDAFMKDHLARRQAGAALVKALGPAKNYRTNVREVIVTPGGTPQNAPVPLTVGATATLRFNNTSCTTSAPLMTGRVVYVGPKAIAIEDNAAPLAGKIDTILSDLAQKWEQTSYPLLVANMGDPLAYDAHTDNNGRIIMMFTPRVNALNGVAGFVNPCDFYPPSTAPSVSGSNQAEIFYAWVPTDTSSASTVSGATSSTVTAGVFRWETPFLLTHESKHLASAAERNETPILTDDEDAWLEESTAQVAGELFGRTVDGNAWRSNSNYQSTIYCERRYFTTASCKPYILSAGHFFGFMEDALASPETHSVLAEEGDGDTYGISWLFARWLADAYGGNNEGAFYKSIVQNFTHFGTDNVMNVTGKTWPELLTQFALMLGADEKTTAPAVFQEASWNLVDIWNNYHNDTPKYPATINLRQSNFASAFTTGGLTLHGGSFVLVSLSGTSAPATTQLLDLHDIGGTPLGISTPIALSVLRIQ